ncbi:hypothetical protein AV530_012568 [Patagioenas fasciata monilis]|uniref:Uncharacterized protein n=1 Tax=Patagioenas fasciata monilis TaxID=372326 RepID=A0A1V4JBY9_PATFA|nr:hypothetical protein AV530_012568 [Patagioenas fasciata monilis]
MTAMITRNATEITTSKYTITEITSRDFNLPNADKEYHTAGINMSRRFLKHLDNNFLVQVLRDLTRKVAFLDLILTNREGLVGYVATGGSLFHNDDEEVRFKIFANRRKTSSQTLTLDMRRSI